MEQTFQVWYKAIQGRRCVFWCTCCLPLIRIRLLQLSRTSSSLTKEKLLSQTQLVRSHSDLSQTKLARTNSSLSQAHLAQTNSSSPQMKPRQTNNHLPQAQLARTGSVLEELARTYSHLSPTQPRAQPQAQLSRANSDGTMERLRTVTRAPIIDRPLIEGL